MKYLSLVLFLLPASAESLRYAINWPSGLSLGEATLRSDRTGEGPDKGRRPWSFELNLDASVPGFAVRDDYRSRATSDLCTVELDKDYAHGKRKGQERLTFDQEKNTVSRETLNGGGKSELSVSPCAREALTFLQFARTELAQGRLAPQQEIVFGGVYQVRLEYTGTQSITLDERRVDADRVVATLKGPSSNLTIELFFARDAARTPVFARIPLPLGAFTVELVR
jgi:uncharacterized protein DUF3108